MKIIIQYKYILCLFFVVMVSCKKSKQDQSKSHAAVEKTIYTCSMHPEIIRDEPGNCPICGMQLVKKEVGSKKVSNVKLEMLLKPTNEFVISTLPKTTIEKRERAIEIESLGKIDYDTKEVGTISA